MMLYRDLVKGLVNERLRQIDDEPEPEVVVGKMSDRLLDTVRTYHRMRRTLAKMKRRLDRIGLEVTDHGSLHVTYTRRNRVLAQWKAKQAARVRRVQDLRLKAQIAVLDMPAATAKKYLSNLQRQLGRI